uniref:X-prolyl aminopeptidase 3 n=1 Tax=Equus asinus TaxID=9793 RepID=A0A9L0IML5_EQUAS
MLWLLSAAKLVPAVASARSLSGCVSCSQRRYSLQPIPERRVPNRYLGQPSPFTHPHLLRPVNDTSVSLSEGFLLLILHQTGIPAGKLAETQEMQLTTETHKKSVFQSCKKSEHCRPFLLFMTLPSLC